MAAVQSLLLASDVIVITN